ncbi:MAG: hypothetical protein MI976_05330 [Pseudomonadales bacterium]|nr:hypothetical protein [Pseudomonadales bacterium]
MKFIPLLMISLMALCCFGCDQAADIDQLAEQLQQQKEKLQPIAAQLKQAGDGSIIDFRDDRLRIEPEKLINHVTDSDLSLLKLAEISFATFDKNFGGTLFETNSKGIGISGSSVGFILIQEQDSTAVFVENIEKAFEAFRSKQGQHSALNIQLIQRVEGDWGIYLETY